MNTIPKLTRDRSMLLVVDLQEKLLPAIHEADGCIAAARKMIQAAGILQVPVLATEQYPAGLGHTVPAIQELLADAPIVEKTLFSACVGGVMERLKTAGRASAEPSRPAVIVVGIEAHVCVLQTVLDLLRADYPVYVCADAVSSRRPFDRDIALQRLRHAGAIVTTVESAVFELLGQAGGDAFKQILKIVK